MAATAAKSLTRVRSGYYLAPDGTEIYRADDGTWHMAGVSIVFATLSDVRDLLYAEGII